MKDKIEDWLKRVIEAHHIVMDLSCGPENIRLCTGWERNEIHIFQSLEKLAYYLGVTVTYNPNWDIQVGEMSFVYHGVRFYELWKKAITDQEGENG